MILMLSLFKEFTKSLVLVVMLSCWFSSTVYSSEDITSDRELVKNAGFDPPNTASLTPFFRIRSSPIPSRESVDKAIALLLGSSATQGIAAKRDLICWGDFAVPSLRTMIANTVKPGAENIIKECINLIEGKNADAFTTAALRILAFEAKPESVEVLFDFLPFAEEETLRNEVESALKILFTTSLETGLIFEKKTSDKNLYKRAVSAEILTKNGNPSQIALAKKLLNDPSSLVRTRLVLALLEQNDRSAIPIALNLLASESKELSSTIEASLVSLAGEWAIQGAKNDDVLSKKINQAAWNGWWKSINEQDLLEPFKNLSLATTTILDLDKASKSNNTEFLKTQINNTTSKDNLALQNFFLNRASFDNNFTKVLASENNNLKSQLQNKQITPALIRIISLVKPPHTLETIINYIPSCSNETLHESLIECVRSFFIEGSDLPKPLVEASKSLVEEIRGFAGKALASSPNQEAKKICNNLLLDPSTRVRFEVATAMVKNKQKVALPVLIELLGQVSEEKVEVLDHFLRTIAKDKSPEVTPDQKKNIKLLVDAWNNWLKKEGTQLVLEPYFKGTQTPRNFLLVEAFSQEKKSGRVFLMTPQAKILWEIANLSNPIDASLLINGRVLVTEQGANRITERDAKGNISWEKSVANPFHSQRLANGNTFIASRNKLLEVSKNGSEVFGFSYVQETILAACKTRNNEYALLTYSGTFLKIDPKGNEIFRSRIPFPTNFGINGATITANDRVLVSIPTLNKILEFDFNGQSTWEVAVTMPGVPTKLANGNVVTPSQNGSKVIEVRMDGKIAWESQPSPFRINKAGKY